MCIFVHQGTPLVNWWRKHLEPKRKVFLKYPDKVQFTYKIWRKSTSWPIWVMRTLGRQPLNTYFFLHDKLPISMKMLVFFLAKCVRNAVKTMVVDRKNQKTLALLYLASKPLRKAANSSGVPTEFEQNRQGKFELFTWTLSPKFFRLNWTFPLPPKRQLSILLNFFSINNFVFDFCCLCLFCYNAGQHAISRQKHMGMQHRVISSVWSLLATLLCGRTDGRTYVRTVTRLLCHYQKFLGLIGYQISLAMELRWRASALIYSKVRVSFEVHNISWWRHMA